MNNPAPKSDDSGAKPTPITGKKAAAKPKPSAGTGKGLLFLSLLFAVLAIAISGWLWYQQLQIQAATQQELTQLQKTLRALDEHPSLIELKQRVLEQGEKLDATVAEQLQQIDAVKQAFTATQQIINRDQQGWVIAEIEYLIRLAIIRLRLTRDPLGATEALIIADQRLADLADPALLEVREILAGEISALKMMSVPDLEGAALQLITLSNQLHVLPQAKRPAITALEETIEPEPVNVFSSGWNKLLGFIGVRRSNAPVATAALQAELYYVEQLIHLELESAKRAVLEFNKEKLDRHLLNARSLLDEHYDRDHDQVIRIRAELARLQESELIAPLPDISGSLQKLRELQLKYKPVTPTQAIPDEN